MSEGNSLVFFSGDNDKLDVSIRICVQVFGAEIICSVGNTM